MKTRALGRTGIEVGCVGLGAMPLSIAGRPTEADSVRVIHAALDAGMTLLDTADVYCLDDSDLGHNERLIARALREWPGRRDGVIIATKGGLERPRGSWVTNGHPDHLRQACERSLRALGVETIDLYQLHSPDPRVPFAESVGALADLQAAGKIRHLGLSNVDLSEIEVARLMVAVVSVQNCLNPFDLTPLLDGTVASCERDGIAFLPHSPVGGHRGHLRVQRDPLLQRVAARQRATPYQVCLAWLLALSPAMIPIPGASRMESARSSAAAAELTLTGDDLQELGRAVAAGADSSDG